MAASFRFCRLFAGLLGLYILTHALPLQAQTAAQARLRFNKTYIDSTGSKLDSLPVYEDSVFVKNKRYYYYKVTEKGKVDGGLDAFDDLTLNLALKIGEEEERELGTAKKIGSWLANFIVRVASLSFYDLAWGANRLFFDKYTLNSDMRRIRSLYENKGYFESRIVRYRAEFSDDREYMTIHIYIQEGKPTTLAETPKIKIVSTQPLVDFKDKLNEEEIVPQLLTQKGDPIGRDNIELSKATIQKIFAQNGYPSADVSETIDTVSHGRYKASIEYMVVPGRYTVFGKTTISGNYYKNGNSQTADTTKNIVEDKVILRKVRYKANRPFNPDQLALSIGQINGLGVFRSVKPLTHLKKGKLDSTWVLDKFEIDSVKEKSGNRLLHKVPLRSYGVSVDTMAVNISVAERKERSIKPGVGFTTDFIDRPESEKKKGLSTLPFMTFQISWQSKNFYGGARKLQISGIISKGFQTNGIFFANYMQTKITFRQPAFKLPLTRDADNDLITTFSFERNNTAAFDVKKFDASPTFVRQFTREFSANLTPFSFTRVLEKDYAGDSTRTFFTTNQKFGITYNSSNDFFFPTTGFLIYANTDFAGFTLPSDLKYIKLNWDNRRYFGLSERLSVAVRARAGSAIPYRTNGQETTIPVSEQFYAGGPNSVRGWGIKELGIIEEDTTNINGEVSSALKFIGGNSIIEGGIEFRYNLYVSRDPSEAITGMDLATFLDVGNVWTEYNFKNKPRGLPRKIAASVGAGMRIRTLVGPFRIDVGYKLADPAKMKVKDESGVVRRISKAGAKQISRIGIQVTLGQAF
ncbi:BamA/TamA family outer membrane protein [bacterium]|nr:BamA/TamA family outer membrane protein [bacterium]